MMTTTKPAKKSKPVKTFTSEEVNKTTLKYFNGDELATSVWMSKYAMKNKAGDFLEKTPDQMHHRMAKEFARIELKYRDKHSLNGSFIGLSEYGKLRERLSEKQIYNYFKDFKYVVPQGSVMSSLGNGNVIASLSNCIVLPEIYDSYGGIIHTDQQMAQLFKRRCGVGIDISTLRPKGSNVSNAAGTTSGAGSFMERFSNTTREVAQNGRRGALMITMDIAHPDIEDFVTVKQDLSKVTGANISVRISDEFMKAVTEDTDYTLRWPIDAEKPTTTKTIRAKDLWDTIIKCAHNTAEPGLIYWDRQHYYSTSSVYPGYKNTSTNPCSEIAMQGGDSCRLIALNLLEFVKEPFTKEAEFDFDLFYETTYESQRLMDDLVDLELEAIEKILAKISADDEPDFIKSVETETWKLLYKAGKNGRRTGLGFTALADAVAALGLKFDSDKTLEVVDKIMMAKCRAEFDSSIDMSIERGSFTGFDTTIENTSEFVQMMQKDIPDVYDRMMKYGRRNISISTVAPTGSLSLLTQTSSGVEPVFMLSYKRRKKINSDDEGIKVDFVDDSGDKWQEFTIYHNRLKQWMEVTGNKDETKSPYYKSTAPEIDWKKRIELQAVIQKYTTHSISSTINLPENISKKKVSDIYEYAWEKGLKGITVYREGSRAGVLVKDEAPKAKSVDEIIESRPPRRPDILDAKVVRFQNNNEKWLAVVAMINEKPYEIFTGRAVDSFFLPTWVDNGWVIKGRSEEGVARYDFRYLDKDGYRVTIEGLSRSFNKEFWNYAKLISSVLRHGMPLPYVVDLVSKLNLFDESINNWKNGVTRTLKQFIPDGTKVKNKCAECGDPDGLVYEEGCLKCKSCGHSKCG